MKKYIILIMAITCALLTTACASINLVRYPTDGIWLCEEIKMSINFNEIYTTDMNVSVYDEDGNIKIVGCHIDWSSSILFFEENNGEEQDYNNGIYNGEFKWKKDEFIVTAFADGRQYIFRRQSSD